MQLNLIDFDGTLFDTSDALYSAYYNAMEMCANIKLSKEVWDEFFGRSIYDIYEYYNITDASVMKDIRDYKYNVYPRNYYRRIKQLDYIKLDISNINVICSSTNKHVISMILKNKKINNLINDIITPSDVFNKNKPEPDIYIEGIKRYYNKNIKIVNIYEDSDVGLESAYRAKRIFNDINIIKVG